MAVSRRCAYDMINVIGHILPFDEDLLVMEWVVVVVKERVVVGVVWIGLGDWWWICCMICGDRQHIHKGALYGSRTHL